MIDRPGIFKVRPLSWAVWKSETSKSVGINLKFQILEMLHESVWHDWMQYGDFHAFGHFYVVKSDGGVNERPAQQLAESLGWNGTFAQVQSGPPPDVLVQVTVKEETYQGKTRLKVEWMNPVDYVPQPRGEDASSVKQLDAMFGSQLRALMSSSAKPKPTGKPPPPRTPPPSRPDRFEGVAPATEEEAVAMLGPEDDVPPSLHDTDNRREQ